MPGGSEAIAQSVNDVGAEEAARVQDLVASHVQQGASTIIHATSQLWAGITQDTAVRPRILQMGHAHDPARTSVLVQDRMFQAHVYPHCLGIFECII